MKNPRMKYNCPHCGCSFLASDFVHHLENEKCGEYLQGNLGRDFDKEIFVNIPNSKQIKARIQAVVCINKKDNTIGIELYRLLGIVNCVVQTPRGFNYNRLNEDAFDNLFKPIYDYHPGRAAMVILEHAKKIGATKQAMKGLERLVDIDKEQINIAVSVYDALNERDMG